MDTKKPGCELRKYEKSRLQYDLVKTEEPGSRIDETLRSLVAPLPRGQRISRFTATEDGEPEVTECARVVACGGLIKTLPKANIHFCFSRAGQ